MRTITAIIVLGLSALEVSAQNVPRRGRITADSTVLRSGPSEQMPETGTLYRGTIVEIDHEEPGGWLAIEPPRGQVSWLNHLNVGPAPGQAVDALPRNAIVHAEPDTMIAIGRAGFGQPLDVRRTKVPDGTLVLVIGHKVEHAGSHWLPIEPPHGDFRYIRSDAVDVGAPLQTFAVRSPKVEPQPLAPNPSSAPGTTMPASATTEPRGSEVWPNHPFWQQGEQAERDGDFTRAEQLFLRLAAEMNQPGGDVELANLCYTRVHAVREKARNGGGARLTSRPADPVPVRTTAVSGQWTESGVIRLAGFRVGGQSTYALVGSGGKLICYALSGPGVELDRFRGYEVELYGPMTHPSDLRGTGVVTVSQVRMPRGR